MPFESRTWPSPPGEGVRNGEDQRVDSLALGWRLLLLCPASRHPSVKHASIANDEWAWRFCLELEAYEGTRTV